MNHRNKPVSVYVGPKCCGTFTSMDRAEKFLSVHVADHVGARMHTIDVSNRIAPPAIAAQGRRGNRQRERIPSFNLDVGVY